MNRLRNFTLLVLALLTTLLGSCKHDPTPSPVVEPPVTPPSEISLETPFTTVPDELVGTWFASHNVGSLTTDWEQGSFQGEPGFREFRTMIFINSPLPF